MNVSKDNRALLEFDSKWWQTKKVMEAIWDVNNGIIQIIAKNDEIEIHKSELTYEFHPSNPFTGTANFTTTIPVIEIPLNIYTKFDIGGEKKNAAFILNSNDHFVTMSTIYHMTEDTFNGELLWKSSIEVHTILYL